jgi:hypothetical protein
MSEYGLTVYNDNGGLMFDSSRKMNSYIITEIGTGTSPSTTVASDDFLFVKIPSNQASSFANTVIFMGAGFNAQFYGRVGTFNNSGDSSFANATAVTLDYFVVKHSSKVSSTDDYGLTVYNEDNTIQFDSRSIKLGQHFQITEYHEPRSVDAWSTTNGGISLGSNSDYWEISNWTSGTLSSFGGPDGGDTSLIGLMFSGAPYAINYYSLAGSGFGGGNEGPFFGGGSSTTSSETWGNSITGMILSAELI